MKKHTPLSFKQLLLACIFLLIFAAFTLFLFSYKRDEKRFQHLTNEIFMDEMQSNTLNMHYSIAYPEDFGIYHYEPVLPCYSAQGHLASQVVTENTLEALRSIAPENLSRKDAPSYHLLLRSLENSLSKSQYPYYDEPLSPHSGMQSQLPILLAEYTFRNKRDVEDYLALLEQTDAYFDSLLTYEQEKADAGLLMSSSSLAQVVEQCDTIVTKEALEEGTHFLQNTFQERIHALVTAQELTQEEALSYLTVQDRLLKEVLLPAYEALADGLFVLSDDSIPIQGLASHPDGRSYYEYLLVGETGSYRPVSEIKEMLSAQFDLEYQAMHDLLLESPQLQTWYADGGEIAFPVMEAEEILADLQERMAADFPSFPSEDALLSSGTAVSSEASALPDLLPQVTVKSVSPSLEEYCAPAFYLTAPIDDTSNNVIYINEGTAPTGLELYTTLAHEGYPGHLYQTVYSNRFFARNGENKVRQLLWYGGYLEGWALYTEFLSFDYASALLEEHDQSTEALAVQLEKHNRSLQLCLYSLLDIMIHYEGASYSQIAKVLDNFGIRDSNAAARVYAYIAEEPCNYLKYYLGYLEFMSLRDTARAHWDTAYTDYAFHSFVLECGPSDFPALEERLLETSLTTTVSTATTTMLQPIFLCDHRKSGSGSVRLSPTLPVPPDLGFPQPHRSSAGERSGAGQMLFSLFP